MRRRCCASMPGGIRDVQHRVALRAALHALIDARQKAAAPQRLAAVGPLPRLDQHDEARQILVLAAQAVRQPRAHARPAELRRAGVEEELRRRVVELVGAHRLDDRDVVDDRRQVRQQVRYLTPRSGRASRTCAACRASSARP